MSHHTPFAQIKARGVIIKDGKIFLAKHAKGGFFCLPGGTLELGETIKKGLAREMFEEFGVVPEIWPLVYTQELIREKDSVFDFWYWIENPSDFVNIDISKASHGHENSKVGFYDPETTEGDIRPKTLTELLAIWSKEPRKFVEQLAE